MNGALAVNVALIVGIAFTDRPLRSTSEPERGTGYSGPRLDDRCLEQLLAYERIGGDDALGRLVRVDLQGDQAARPVGERPAQVPGRSGRVPVGGVLRRDRGSGPAGPSSSTGTRPSSQPPDTDRTGQTAGMPTRPLDEVEAPS